MSTHQSTTNTHTENRSLYTVLSCGFILLISVLVFACQDKRLDVFIAALFGSALGFLYAFLDHETFSMKREALLSSELTNVAYAILRISIPTAIGYGASYIAFGESNMDSTKQYAVAFSAAYVVDAGKLIASK